MIFPTKKFRLVCDITSAVVIAWFISIFFASIFQMNPVHRYWTPGTPGTQINNHFLFIYSAASAVALDIWTLCLPLPIIRRLHMRSLKKWLLIGIFWLGSL